MAALGPGVQHYVQAGQPMNIRSPMPGGPPGMVVGGPGSMQPVMRPQQHMPVQHQANVTMMGPGGPGMVVPMGMGPGGGPGQQMPMSAMSSPGDVMGMGGGPASAVSSPQMVTSTTGGPPSVPTQHQQLQPPPQQHPQHQQQQSQVPLQQHHPLQRPHDTNFDSVSKAKALLAPLKNSLEALIKNAAQTLHQNSMMDLGILRVPDKAPERFEKAMEEFCALCDEIQLHLIAALEMNRAHYRSNKFVPTPVNLSKIDNSSQSAQAPGAGADNTLSYPQYLNTVRSQVGYVNDLRKMLMDFARGLTP